MTETIRSNHGSRESGFGRPKPRIRSLGVLLAILVGTVLILWVGRAVWSRLDNLQLEFSGLQVDNFYFGLQMQSSSRRLDSLLQRYRLGPVDEREEHRDSFQRESRELKQWLDCSSTNTFFPGERDLVRQIVVTCHEYLQEADAMFGVETQFTDSGAGVDGASDGQVQAEMGSYQRALATSETLRGLCEEFINQQRSSFEAFLSHSKATLKTFQRSLRISMALVLALATVLVVLMYRGMIAPLRHQLIKSRATIARQEKLASLGSLAAGVAHEIRNPLTAIRFRLFSLRKALPGSASESEDAAVIASELDRLERIVNDFLRFARPSEPELVSLPAQRLLKEVVDLMQPQLAKSGIELKLEDSDPLWIRADTHQIKQVMINLIQNAGESLKGDGSITLRVRRERTPLRSRNGFVAVEVSDTGGGVPKELEERLFDPFFTTKEGGTGLGLPIAARIVEKHGGVIRYRTNSDGGATFSVVLPHVEEHEPNHSAH